MPTKRIRVIVDTNLWISALIGRQLSSLRELLSYPSIELIITERLMQEVLLVARWLSTVQAKAVYLVSGDSDLLEMESIGECRIMTVRQFEQEIWEQI